MRASPRKQYLPAIIEYFVHPSLRSNHDKYHRVRILIGALLTFAVVPLVAFGIVLTTDIPVQYGRLICLSVSALFMGLLILTRQKGLFLFCSISTVLATLFAIVGGISVTGGPAESPVVQLIVITPLTAYFFGGLRWGGYAVGTSFFSLIVLYALHFGGFPFLQTIRDGDQMRIAYTIVSILNFFIISTMAYIYEATAVALKNERDTEHQKYIHLAKTDPLTGLANRRNFDAILLERMELYGAQDPPRRFALGCLDLDGFKPINDQYGHAVGDEVLRVVASRLRAALRGSDFVGRHGGDEFMLLLDMVGDQAALEAMAQRMLNSIATPIKTTAGLLQVSGSMGFAMFPLDSNEIEELKKFADAAMYGAKQQHGTWRFYRKGA